MDDFKLSNPESQDNPPNPEIKSRTDDPPVGEPSLVSSSRMATIGEEKCHFSATTDKRCDKMPPGMNLRLRVISV